MCPRESGRIMLGRGYPLEVAMLASSPVTTVLIVRDAGSHEPISTESSWDCRTRVELPMARRSSAPVVDRLLP